MDLIWSILPQVCIYTNAAFLAAADSKRFVLFNVKDGNFVGVIQIPNHLERNKGEKAFVWKFLKYHVHLFLLYTNFLYRERREGLHV